MTTKSWKCFNISKNKYRAQINIIDFFDNTINTLNNSILNNIKIIVLIVLII